jgi:predicted kinase
MILNEKPTLLCLSGLPASGKSTYAERWLAEDPERRFRINWDDLRLQMFGSNWKWNRDGEKLMQEQSREQAAAAIVLGKSVIIDNTNLTEGARAKWQKLASDFGASYVQHEIDTPVAECVRRDRQREKRVGRAVIERMALFHGFIDWNELPPKWSPSKGEPDIVIVDIDGTLSEPGGRLRHVKGTYTCKPDCKATELQRCKGHCQACGAKFTPRWDLFHAEVDKDAPKPRIAKLVKCLSLHYWIIIVSGRSPEHGCGIKTEDWLEQHLGIPYLHLFMRQSGDYKPDYEHKKEILDLLPKHRIAFCLDDRQQVVDMWRENGLTCLQVANGDF